MSTKHHMKKAIVIGSINMDIVTFVSEHPKIGETVFGREVRYFPGGKGGNQAVACKRLGCETVMLGRLGDDPFGQQLLAFQNQEGIDTQGVRQLPGIVTGTAFITVADDSSNSIIVIPGANAVWDASFIGDVSIAAGDIVVSQFEIPDEAILKAFHKAKAQGATTLLNPAPVRAIDNRILDLTDLIVVNEHELALLSGSDINIDNDDSIFAAAANLRKTDHQTLIVTLGERGLRILQHEKRYSLAVFQVDAIDTTGAGDTFIGGLVAGLLSGQDLLDAAQFGNLAASISVTRAGAAASIPTLAEVQALLNSQSISSNSLRTLQ